MITFLDSGVLAAADTVFAPGHHLFHVIDGEHNIDNWITLLQSVAERTDIDVVLTGHGPTTEPKAAARAQSTDAAADADAIKTRYPHHHDPSWADFGSQILYGLLTP